MSFIYVSKRCSGKVTESQADAEHKSFWGSTVQLCSVSHKMLHLIVMCFQPTHGNFYNETQSAFFFCCSYIYLWHKLNQSKWLCSLLPLVMPGQDKNVIYNLVSVLTLCKMQNIIRKKLYTDQGLTDIIAAVSDKRTKKEMVASLLHSESYFNFMSQLLRFIHHQLPRKLH